MTHHVQYGFDPGVRSVGPGSAALNINVNDEIALGSSSSLFVLLTSARFR